MFNDFQNKKIIIMGLGLYEQGSGGMAAQFFAKRGAKVLVTDLRTREQLKPALERLKKFSARGGSAFGEKNIKYVLGRHRPQDFRNADIIFQNPSVPADSPYLKIAKRVGIPIVNDWSIFLSVHQPKIFVGVTGTRGKSTTTMLIYEMIKKKHRNTRLAGNLGVSPLTLIDSYKGEPIVAELSSWLLHHFDAAKKSPNIAVVTNIMNDHMDKYKSQREYIADKENIFRFQKPGDVVVLSWDNQYTRAMGKKIKFPISNFQFPKKSKIQNPKSKIIWFSLKKHLPKWVPLNQVKLMGEHNLQNALAASAAAEAVGVPCKDIIAVLKTFRGLPNRLELVCELNGVKYYNDTTATTPEATIAALVALAPLKVKNPPHLSLSPWGRGLRRGETKIKNIVLICGGADKKLDYKELAKYIKYYCKALVLLPGKATNKIRFQVSGFRFQVLNAKNMQDAVAKARKVSLPGDIVLLSPAAASFGLFKNEFDRGEQFVKAVKKSRG